MARTRNNTGSADAGPVRTLQDVIPRTERLLEAYAAGQRERGVTGVMVLVPSDVLAQELAARDGAAAGFGARIGLEWVDTRLVGKSLLSCIYLEKFTAGLLVWRLVWYDNGEAWAVARLNISADLGAMVHLLPNPAQAS